MKGIPMATETTDRTDFYVGELKKYEGWSIRKPVRTPKHYQEDEQRFGLLLESPDGKKNVVLWILQDDEDNGSGSFNVEEMK